MGGTCVPIALSRLLLDEPEDKYRKVEKLKAVKSSRIIIVADPT